jgi:hypothetical protein
VAPLFATCRHRPCASFAMALSGDCVAPRNVRRMAPSPRHCLTARHGGPCSAIGTNGFIQVEAAVTDRMRAMRRPERATAKSSCGSSNWRQAIQDKPRDYPGSVGALARLIALSSASLCCTSASRPRNLTVTTSSAAAARFHHRHHGRRMLCPQGFLRKASLISGP